MWAALTAARGVSGRDALWAHPDLAPTAQAFEDPAGFAGAGPSDDAAMDAALAALLDGPAGAASTEGPGGEEHRNESPAAGDEADGPGEPDDGDGSDGSPRQEGTR